jgi:putative tricarboxylic transport membrane protein
MGTPKRFSPEAVFDLLLSGGGIAIIVVSLSYGFGTFRKPGPGLFPFFIGLFILLFSILLLPAALRSPERPVLFTKSRVRIFLLMIAAFFLWILLIPLLGYVVVTPLVTYGFCKVMGLEGWRKPLLLSAGTSLFLYLLFDYWLYIDLPRGILS